MGFVKDWGSNIAHMVFDELMSEEQIVDVLQNQATIHIAEENLGSSPPDRNWLKQQVTAVRLHPEIWHHDPDFWERLRLRRDRFANRFNARLEDIRKLTPIERNKRNKDFILEIAFGRKKHLRK